MAYQTINNMASYRKILATYAGQECTSLSTIVPKIHHRIYQILKQKIYVRHLLYH